MNRVLDKSLLRSTEGIDSIHIDLAINSADLKRFCNSNQLKLEEREKTKWQRKWRIFLAGDPINVTYHFRSKRTTLEFGGFLDYTKDPYKLQLLRSLIHFFSDRSWSVSRLDYALDVNLCWDMILPDMRDVTTLEFSGSSTYFNNFDNSRQRKKLFTVAIYDKARQISLFSTPLTRVELRLFRPELKRLNLTGMFASEKDLIKTSNLIYSMLGHRLKLHSSDGRFVYRITTDSVKTLQGFLEFLHSDMPTVYRSDPFRIHYGLELSDKITSWMKSEGISPLEVKKHIRGGKTTLCKSLGIDPKTFDKAMSFFKASSIEELKIAPFI